MDPIHPQRGERGSNKGEPTNDRHTLLSEEAAQCNTAAPHTHKQRTDTIQDQRHTLALGCFVHTVHPTALMAIEARKGTQPAADIRQQHNKQKQTTQRKWVSEGHAGERKVVKHTNTPLCRGQLLSAPSSGDDTRASFDSKLNEQPSTCSTRQTHNKEEGGAKNTNTGKTDYRKPPSSPCTPRAPHLRCRGPDTATSSMDLRKAHIAHGTWGTGHAA